jgi:hypothetical protein
MGLVLKWTMTLKAVPSLRQPCASVTFLERVQPFKNLVSTGELWVPLCYGVAESLALAVLFLSLQFVHADRDLPTCWMKGQQDGGW